MSGGKWLTVQYTIFAVALGGVAAVALTGFTTAGRVAGPAMLFYDVVAVVFGFRAYRHPGLARPLRPAVRTFTVTAVLILSISLTFSVTGTTAFPQPGDVMHLATMIALFVGLLQVPLRRAGKRESWKLLLDSGTVVLGAAMVLWYVAIGPALDNTADLAKPGLVLAAAGYPVVDLLVLFALARLLLRGTGLIGPRPLWLLGLGVVSLLGSDAYLGWAQAHMAVVPRTTFDFACWLIIHFLFACTLIELWRQAAHPVALDGPRRRRVAGKLPYLGIGVGYTLMAVATFHESSLFPWSGLVLGGMGITGMVVARQLLVQRESTEAAETDALTGLANRARLHDELNHALRRGGRTGVLLIDLNGFKGVNDRLGHQVGDGLLVAVAGAMSRAVRGDDMVGRLGGDEFAVVVKAVSGEADAVAVAKRITEAIAGPFVVGDLPMSASASIGVAVSDPGETGADGLLHRADVAMYDVKRRGSGWQAWHPGLGADVTPEQGPESELRELLDAPPDDGRLSVAYRPIFSLNGDRIGADAMLCWNGRVLSAELLAVAARTGATARLGDRLLSLVPAAPPAGGFTVVAVDSEQLRRPGFHAPGLVLEVPSASQDQDLLTDLRTAGARIAVRDFGTSFADLTALSTMPVDFLRLDAPPVGATAEALIRLGQTLGLTVLTHGLEIPPDAAQESVSAAARSHSRAPNAGSAAAR
ncbi:diguanylate cyclase domain-containing protein [Actinoplanes sp. G11-F43]|uniref:diguanylate cyclase domain-containing protein n=1 Tax=Actinoplanes sp. G11-F43 TaxID=3424130 RepID=UPI003D324FC3